MNDCVLMVAVAKQRVVPSKVVSTTEDKLRSDERETEETMLELLKPFTEGVDNSSSNTAAWSDPKQSAKAHSDDGMPSVREDLPWREDPRRRRSSWVHTPKKKPQSVHPFSEGSQLAKFAK